MIRKVKQLPSMVLMGFILSKPIFSIPLETALPKITKGLPIAIYTGAFDPFHKGHAAIVKKLTDMFPFVIVHADQYFKPQKPNCLNSFFRHKMLEAMYKNHPRVLLSDWPIAHIFAHLEAKGAIFYGVIGSDHIEKPKPYDPDQWIVHVRPCHEQTPAVKNLNKRLAGRPLRIIRVPQGYISSTMIRNDAKGRHPKDHPLVPKPARNVIVKYALYE
jgi:cytidyltransferase-like protein